MPYGTMKKVGPVKKSSSSGKGYSKVQPSMSKSKKKIVPGVPTPSKKRPLVKPRAKGSAVRGRTRGISRPMAGSSGTKKQIW